MPVEMPELFTIDHLVEAYDLSRDTVYDWLRLGEEGDPNGLVGFKLGRSWRIDPADWEAFLQRRRAAHPSAGPAVAPAGPAKLSRRRRTP